MYVQSLGFAATVFSALSLVDGQRLDKPPLTNDLEYLRPGLLDNLPSVNQNHDKWGDGWIAQDCKNMAEEQGLNAADVETWNVKYDDVNPHYPSPHHLYGQRFLTNKSQCGDAWVVCHHKDAQSSLDDLIAVFGRLPVHTRQFVRHVIALPDDGAWAYNSGGNIAMFADVIHDNPAVFLHEAGHSLDLLNAYLPDQALSSSQNWIDNYNQDSNVPDNYAQSNQVENVAQNTVVDTFNLVVDGGFASVQPNYQAIFHQFATVDTKQREAGDLLVPGGSCTSRLTNSAPVEIGGGAKSRVKARMLKEKPDVSLSANVARIEPKDFHTGEMCAETFGKKMKKRGEKPNVELSSDVNVIPPKDFKVGGYPGRKRS
ncbi:MAG: hypothetical protein Q9167_001666 [Letrouitia subvulpina]